MDCSAPGFPVLPYLPEFAQTHAHLAGEAIQPSHPLLRPSPPALSLSQHQGLFRRVSASHQGLCTRTRSDTVAKRRCSLAGHGPRGLPGHADPVHPGHLGLGYPQSQPGAAHPGLRG